MGSSSFFIISTLYISLLPVLVYGNGCLTGGINGERLCCEGKDVTCFANGYQPYYRSCYCDAACTYSQDCCGDYYQTCQAVDCRVSAWSYWDGCSVRCGIGIKTRTRSVITEPQNSGQKCPPLRQVKACFSSFCDITKKYGNSVALILPYHLGVKRDEAQHNAVNNFFYRDRMTFKSYCVYFKLRHVNKRCYTDTASWTASLRKPKIACVECDRPAYGTDGHCHGEGIIKEKTRFVAVDVKGCRGRWIQQSIESDCKCNTGEDYIFV